jgi:hypothetical protein
VFTTSSCFSCHHAARTWSCSATGSIQLSLLVSPLLGGHTGIDLSRPLFTCTNANQAATCTCNTQQRISPHHVVNHSSHQGATIHRSSDAPVLNLPLDECIDTTHSHQFIKERERKEMTTELN